MVISEPHSNDMEKGSLKLAHLVSSSSKCNAMILMKILHPPPPPPLFSPKQRSRFANGYMLKAAVYASLLGNEDTIVIIAASRPTFLRLRGGREGLEFELEDSFFEGQAMDFQSVWPFSMDLSVMAKGTAKRMAKAMAKATAWGQARGCQDQ